MDDTRKEQPITKDNMELDHSNLKSRLVQLEAQANKYFHMKLQKDVMDKKLSKLQVDMTLKQRSIRKMKSKTAKFRKDVSEKSSSLKKMEHHLKKIWSLLLVLGNKLGKNGLLTMEEKDKLKIGYEEWFILLVSQDKRKTEEVLNMLNDLPISLFEVLNDSTYLTQKYDSKLNEEHFDKEQNLIPSTSDSTLQAPKDNVSSVQDSFSHTPNAELSSKYYNDDSSSTESEGNNSIVTSHRLSVDEPSSDHNIVTSQSVFADDSENDSDVFDHKSFTPSANSCDISKNSCDGEAVKPLPHNLLKIVPDQNNLNLFGNLEDQSDTESYGMNGSQPSTCKLHVSEKPDDKEGSVNIDIFSNNKHTDSTSSQMTLVESSVLNSANINTVETSTHFNLNTPDFIPEKNIVSSKYAIDDNSKDDSESSPVCKSKISDDTVIVKDSKTTSNKIITQLSKNKYKKIQNKPSQTVLEIKKSLQYDYESDVNPPPQNNDILKDNAKNKRTTIMLPGPPMKMSRKSKQCLTEKNESEQQDISYPLQQNFFPTSSVKRFHQSSLCGFPPTKKSKAVLDKGTSDVAPVRVRGRTSINNATLRRKNIEVESNDVVNECDEEFNKLGQTLRSESEVGKDKSMSECNFVSTTKPRKIRKEHKEKIPKDYFENIRKNTDKAGLTSCVNKDNSITNEADIDFLKNVSQKQVDSSKDVLNDLLKKAELSRVEKGLRMEKLPLVKLFKLKSKGRNLTRGNVSKYAAFKKGISQFHKQKSKDFISNISKSQCTNKVQLLKIKNKSIVSGNEAFDKARGRSSDASKTLRNKLPLITFENETKMNVNFENNILLEETTEITPEYSDPINSINFTVMKENIFIGSEVPTSIENFNVSSIGGKSTQCAIKCDSYHKTDLVAAETLDDSRKHVKSEENCISENDSDFEGNLVIDEDLDNTKSLVSDKNLNNSSEEKETGVCNEKYLSACDSDSESHLVIDENFDADEQGLISEKKQHKNRTIKKEPSDDLSCSDRNVSEYITSRVKKEHTSLVCTESISHFSDDCGTSTADEGTKSKVISSKNITKEFVSSENIPLKTFVSDLRIKLNNLKQRDKKNIIESNEEGTKSKVISSKNVTKEFVSLENIPRKTFVSDLRIKLNNLKHGTVKKDAQDKSTSIHCAASKSKKNVTDKKNIIQSKLRNNKKGKDSPKINCNVAKSPPEKFFEEFRNFEFTEENVKRSSRILFNFLINPSHFPNNSELLFHVLNYLQATKENPLLSYSANEDSSVLFPLDEICIVNTFFMIDSKKKLHLEGLLKTAVTTIKHLITSNKKFCLYGLAALCRVFTGICKEEGDNLKPVILCGDLLKMKHPFAPYLIASIAGIWKELFQVGSNLPAEEVLFHSCILHGASKRPKLLFDCNWKSSIDIISKYFTALPVNNSKSAINMLKELIQVRCEDDSWNNQYLSLALIILAGYEDWLWTKENLLTEYIIPNLNKYGHETLNENAFDLYCNMYVDALLLTPGEALDTVLVKFFNSSTSQGNSFVQDSAALALMRFVHKKNRQLPPFLSSWLELNKENPRVKQIEPECDQLSMVES